MTDNYYKLTKNMISRDDFITMMYGLAFAGFVILTILAIVVYLIIRHYSL